MATPTKKPRNAKELTPDDFKPSTEDGKCDVNEFKDTVLRRLRYTLALDPRTAPNHSWNEALCYAVRDLAMERFMATMRRYNEGDARRVYYFSLEYLMGRLPGNNLINMEMMDLARETLAQLGKDIDEVLAEEADMGLGNGGLGRLAACFLDSMATMDIPSVGYGILYEYGLFRQAFVNGRQQEHPDTWREHGEPWQIRRPDFAMEVKLYGRVETHFNDFGEPFEAWVGTQGIKGLPWDIPVVGYGSNTVNFMRLWEARATEEFDLTIFNRGGYEEAVRKKVEGETVSKVLYPNDSTEVGKELRLVQQYFFVSCSLKDIIRRFKKRENWNWDDFPGKAAIQLNDTHPAVAIAELMRILVDEEKLGWDYSWKICSSIFGYTNHTLLPEALERWSVPLFRKVLPRHLNIIFEINRRFLETDVEAKWPGDNNKKRELSIIEEGPVKYVRMAYLSVVGSHSVNGVAALHSDLLKSYLLKDFAELYPERFNNKTNGVTPRRWLKLCNPGLAQLITERLGDNEWVSNLDALRGLEQWADDAAFQKAFMDVKRANKVRLCEIIEQTLGESVSPDALFDVQVKRLHEYKRQHLNLLHILMLYHRLLQNPDLDIAPRVFVFGAKAAPGYGLAKTIIHAINAVGHRINTDTRIRGKLKVAYLPNYGVSLAEKIIPAADLSEQISTAGKEASGTGNMKLSLNGAITMGTLDGANVEILEEVGKDNIFIFGLTVQEVEDLRARGYNPWDIYQSDHELHNVIDWLTSGYFTPEEPHALLPIRHSLLDKGDPFLVLADFRAYVAAQDAADKAFRDKKRWARMSILNTARMGKFSSDRTIGDYARDIWQVTPMPRRTPSSRKA